MTTSASPPPPAAESSGGTKKRPLPESTVGDGDDDDDDKPISALQPVKPATSELPAAPKPVEKDVVKNEDDVHKKVEAAAVVKMDVVKDEESGAGRDGKAEKEKENGGSSGGAGDQGKTAADDDDDDDDVPLTQLIPKKPAPVAAATATAADDDDDDDDVPLGQLVAKKAENGSGGGESSAKPKKPKSDSEEPPKKKKKVEGKEDSGKAKASSSEEKKKSKSKEQSSDKEEKKKKKKTVKKSSSSGKQKAGAKALACGERTQNFYSTVKGQLVQKLLCRWWYAIEWPDRSEVMEPPKDYESLDGYPNVFVCVRGAQIGHVLDKRNMNTCPNFTNLSKKPAEELRRLLIKALEEQWKQFQEHEGHDKKMEKSIKGMIDWAKKVNSKKADEEAREEGF